MAFSTSSQIGVDLNNPSATQLFTLNQMITGSDDSEWQYVLATGSLTTGQFVQILSQGTATVLTTAALNAATGGLNIGVAQFNVSAQQYAFVARRGSQLYVLCSGSVSPPIGVGIAGASGVLVTALNAAVGFTMAGVFIIGSAITVVQSVTTAMLVYPRAGVATVPNS